MNSGTGKLLLFLGFLLAVATAYGASEFNFFKSNLSFTIIFTIKVFFNRIVYIKNYI